MYGYYLFWSQSVPWLMGSFMAMTWLVTKCPFVDGFMYGYDMANPEVSPG